MSSCVIDRSHGSPMFLFYKNEAAIFRCSACGCIMADVPFVAGHYDDEDYYTMRKHSIEDIQAEWGFRWRYILQRSRRYVKRQTNNSNTLLDVGAGNGYFVYLAEKEYGYASSGVEISRHQVEFAKRYFDVDLQNVDVHDTDGQYAVVTCFNVIEHVNDPAEMIKTLAERTRRGGIILITTPNPACIHRKILGLRKWKMICPPHHVNIFSKLSLMLLAKNFNLRVLEYSSLSTYLRFIRNLDNNSLLLRRSFFQALRLAGCGADHFFIFGRR